MSVIPCDRGIGHPQYEPWQEKKTGRRNLHPPPGLNLGFASKVLRGVKSTTP